MNLLEKVKLGREGYYSGLKSGFLRLDKYTDNVGRETIELWGANPKAGKTTIVDARYVLGVLANNPDKKIHIKYWAYEISRIEKEAKFAAYFMWKDHGISISKRMILSKGDNRLSDAHFEKLIDVYERRIKPMFGEYDDKGRRIKEGIIDYIEGDDSSLDIYERLMRHANNNGTFEKCLDTNGDEQFCSYEPNDDTYTIVIVDHYGLLPCRRGESDKTKIDNLSRYMVKIRNLLKYTIVLISQFNRNTIDVHRLKFNTDIDANIGDFKGSGNPVQDANNIFAVVNANGYAHLSGKMYQGYDLGVLGGNYRKITLLESRESEAPASISLYMNGGNNIITELPIAKVNGAVNPELQQIYQRIKDYKTKQKRTQHGTTNLQ